MLADDDMRVSLSNISIFVTVHFSVAVPADSLNMYLNSQNECCFHIFHLPSVKHDFDAPIK